jgi:hypothetical protein
MSSGTAKRTNKEWQMKEKREEGKRQLNAMKLETK